MVKQIVRCVYDERVGWGREKERKQSREHSTQDGHRPQGSTTRQIPTLLYLILLRETKTYAAYE
jgi:hypothetical protein